MLEILQKIEELFDGTLGTWRINPVHFELNEYVKPIWLRPHPVSKLHEEEFKKVVERLFLLEVFERSNDSEWRDPFFAQPKPKKIK